MVGRIELMGSVRRVLQDGTRLVTLVGSGGVGKTRLAVELARYIQQDYDAAAVARLADLDVEDAFLNTEQRLVNVINTSLDIIDHQANRTPLDVLIEHLRQRRVLLVLDNCEHLREAVGDVVTILLEDAPELRVVATSRSFLQIWGEQVVTVPPLAIGLWNQGQSATQQAKAQHDTAAAAAAAQNQSAPPSLMLAKPAEQGAVAVDRGR
jgi:non-specific serine/threonine protein kinase